MTHIVTFELTSADGASDSLATCLETILPETRRFEGCKTLNSPFLKARLPRLCSSRNGNRKPPLKPI